MISKQGKAMEIKTITSNNELKQAIADVHKISQEIEEKKTKVVKESEGKNSDRLSTTESH